MLLLGKRMNETTPLRYALQNVFGINLNSAERVCALLNVSPHAKLDQLKVYHYNKLTKICSEHVGINRSRQITSNIKQLIDLKHYKGTRHMFGLPARGQRTRTNACTAKKIAKRALNAIGKRGKK